MKDDDDVDDDDDDGDDDDDDDDAMFWRRYTNAMPLFSCSIAVGIIEERERWKRESGIGYTADKPGKIHTKLSEDMCKRKGKYLP